MFLKELVYGLGEFNQKKKNVAKVWTVDIGDASLHISEEERFPP